MKRLVVALALVAVLGGGAWVAHRHLPFASGEQRGGNDSAYRVGQVTRGDIEQTVTAAGRLDAVDTVDVSSQLSGQITEVLADFNDRVSEGQPLARLDSVTFESKVAEAEARLANANAALTEARAQIPGAQARLTRARSELQRKQRLRNRGVASERDIESAQAEVRIATSELAAARARVHVRETEIRIAAAALQQAQIELERTTIRAPIEGVVIERNVDTGQTVAASLQAPKLFTIARDLRRMELKAFVDEADIGGVRSGQRAVFSVEAFPTRRFEGEVASVRRAPDVIENVTTYTVVISVANPENILLPGMTATARLIVGGKRGVLRVPNAALRFDPEVSAGAAAARQRQGDAERARVWVVTAGGELRPVAVRTGVRDELRTEIIEGELEADQRVAIGFRYPADGS